MLGDHFKQKSHQKKKHKNAKNVAPKDCEKATCHGVRAKTKRQNKFLRE